MGNQTPMIVRAIVAVNILAILAVLLFDAISSGLSPLHIAVGAGLIVLHGAFLRFRLLM